MSKLTAQQVAALKATDKSRRVEVDTGLQLRIASNGTKTWVVRYSVNSRLRDYRLPKPYGIVSDASHTSLADARAEAANIRTLARNGIDVQVQSDEALKAEQQRGEQALAEEAARKALEQRDKLTVTDLFHTWLLDGVRRQDGNAELTRSFGANVLPMIGACPIRELTEHDLRAVLRALVARGINRTAVMARNNLTQMFSWAEKRQPWRRLLADGNPMDLIEIGKIVSPAFDLNYQRERILPVAEIRELHDIFERMHADYDNALNKRIVKQPIEAATERAVWIMLSTMCRVGELSMARWEHIDFSTARWYIPKENVKDKIGSLDVFLSSFALEQFRRLNEASGHSQWCFPGRNNDFHLDVKSISKQIGDRQTMFKKGRDGGPRQPMLNRRQDNSLVLGAGTNGAWTPHDLRRTGATMMQALGVSLDIIDRCQNHVLPGSKVRRHYLHHDYAQEKADAWRRLGNQLNLILSERE